MNKMNNIKVVISRYNENIEWTEKIENVIIYNKGDNINTKHEIKQLPNIGREGHSIFYHIYENYNSLDDFTVFLQGNPFDNSPNLFQNLEPYLVNRVPPPEFKYLSEKMYYTKVFDCPHHSGLPMRITYNKVFGVNITENKDILFGSGAQFIVSRERILKRSRDFYKNIIDILDYHVKPLEGWVIERLHNEIFNGSDIIETPNVPIIIICYNNHKYVKNTIDQILKINPSYKKSIIVMNNSSTNAKTVEYLEHIDPEISIKNMQNNGPWITPENNSDFYNELPEKFILTDPDLEFNKKLPTNFIEILSKLSDKYKTSKIGFAINILDVDNMYPFEYIKNVYEWETKFWIYRNNDEEYQLYHADIDTTFALINKKYWTNSSLRIAGDFTCRHLPFYVNNGINTIEDEYEYYKSSKTSSFDKVFFSYFEENYKK